MFILFINTQSVIGQGNISKQNTNIVFKGVYCHFKMLGSQIHWIAHIHI